VKQIYWQMARCLSPEGAHKGKMNMQSLDLITRVGPTTKEPFRIEAEIDERPVVLNLSPSAASKLREEIDRYLQSRVVW
jgi:hypothetical protein